jgi:hypothetical protein
MLFGIKPHSLLVKRSHKYFCVVKGKDIFLVHCAPTKKKTYLRKMGFISVPSKINLINGSK